MGEVTERFNNHEHAVNTYQPQHTAAECWRKGATTRFSGNDLMKRESEMFGQDTFSFAGKEDIYASALGNGSGMSAAKSLISQMSCVLGKPGQSGDGVKGVEYGGSAGLQFLAGDVKQSKIYAHAIEPGNTTNPSFANELKDLLLKGAFPSDTWHSHPNIKGYDANVFSKEDIEQANVYGLRSYILTPSGQVFSYQGQRTRPFQESDRFGQPYGFFKPSGDFVIYKEQRPGEYGPPMPSGVISRGGIR